jgi:hypothetical protein
VRRVSGQIEAPVLNRLADVAAHPRDALLENRAFPKVPAVERGAKPPQLLPDALIGPLREILVERDLEVAPGELGGAKREERKPALVMGVGSRIELKIGS